MRRNALLLLTLCGSLPAEIRTLTLRQTVEKALQQNPDLTIARLEEQKAREGVRAARDPFYPKVIIGSGLAYTSGYPMSIDGNAPSIMQAKAVASIYNKSKSYEVAQARENERGAGIDSQVRRDEIALRTALLFIDAERAARGVELMQRQVSSLEQVSGAVQARVSEGRELPIENRRAALTLAQTRQRLRGMEGDQEQAESALAVVLGFGAEDRVRAASEQPGIREMPASESETVASALTNSKEVRRLESAMQAKALELKSARAARVPQVDLVAQYALFAPYNNYEQFFNRFERNNGQLGVSVQVPIFAGSASSAQAARAELDISRLRIEVRSMRDRIALDARKAFQDVSKAEGAREVAKLDLELAREQLSILLAQMEEGRVTLRQVEEARSAETEKWMSFYDAGSVLERAQLNLLKQTGNIVAALK
ncbi:MAG TPA: TolC family protein [Bryobacteraceae bacterium]|nr:TolC family protein [Bryobacteraceae bacterium]